MMRPNHTHGDARALRAPEGSSGPAPLSEQLRRRRLLQFDRALKIKIGVVAVIVLAVGIWGYSWIQHRLDHVSEEDARVAADMIAVASRFDGWTTRIPVIQGQKVKKGDVLVEIDSRAAQLKLAELIAQVGELRAQRAPHDERDLVAAVERQPGDLRATGRGEVAQQLAGMKRELGVGVAVCDEHR